MKTYVLLIAAASIADLQCGKGEKVSCPSTYQCGGMCFHKDKKAGGTDGSPDKWHCHKGKTDFMSCSDKDVFCETEYDCGADGLTAAQNSACQQQFGKPAKTPPLQLGCPSAWNCNGRCYHAHYIGDDHQKCHFDKTTAESCSDKDIFCSYTLDDDLALPACLDYIVMGQCDDDKTEHTGYQHLTKTQCEQGAQDIGVGFSEEIDLNNPPGCRVDYKTGAVYNQAYSSTVGASPTSPLLCLTCDGSSDVAERVFVASCVVAAAVAQAM